MADQTASFAAAPYRRGRGPPAAPARRGRTPSPLLARHPEFGVNEYRTALTLPAHSQCGEALAIVAVHCVPFAR